MNTAAHHHHQPQPAQQQQQPQMHAFTVRIKNGSHTRCSFPAMGPDSMTVAEQHECLCQRGEYVSVKPAGVRS